MDINPEKVHLLTLDGGGIRGIIPASILAHLETRLQVASKNPEIRIADCFDLIAGTSTGGILTCLYLTPDENNPGRPKYTAAQIRDFYREYGPSLFRKSLGYKIISGLGLFRSRYSEKALYSFSRKLMGNTYSSEVVKDFLVTSYDLSMRKALFFSKYNIRKHGKAADYKLVDIARATSAAPTYFSPARIFARDATSRHLVDGGVFANNPSMCAYVEGVKLWPEKPIRDYCMLSVGTGKVIRPYRWEKTHKFGFLQWLQPIIDILSSSVAETVDFQMQQLFGAGGVPGSYIRIEPPLLSADPRMDNGSIKNIEALEDAARYYIENNEPLFDRIIESMIGDQCFRSEC